MYKNIIYNSKNSIIYKINNKCIKLIKNDIDLEIVNIIKDMKLDNYYKIYSVLNNSYIYKYYVKDNINILNMPSIYTINNFMNIYKSIYKLTENNILVRDLHDNNVILNKDNIIVIDVDLYKKCNEKDLYYKNMKSLIVLFRMIYKYSITYNYVLNSNERLMLDKIIKLFDINNINKTINNINLLSNYETPIQYFKYYR